MQAESCPHRERLSSYLFGTLSEQEAGHVALHLESCPRCTSVVEALKVLSNASMAEGSDAPALAETMDSEPPAQGSKIPAISTADPPDASTVEAPFLGQLGDYKLLGKLGQGGMGMVYKSLHTKLGRLVALKVLPKERMLDDRAVTRFQREMMAVGALDHPNIVRATDASEAGGTHFLVMEYVDGLDLAELVQRCGPLKVADACELIRQTALGLACAHEHGLVHRDIKPSNVMLTRDGHAKVLDLGLARFQYEESTADEVTAAGQAMGTADYMAPEQVSDSHTVDIRADVYSLGCTFYKLLAGQPPFGGPEYKGTFDKMTAHVKQPVPPIRQSRGEVPDELIAVLDRMLAKDPADRFATPVEVAEALAPWTAGCDLPGLLVQADRGKQSPMTAESALAATSGFHSSALVGTRPTDAGQPRPVPQPARRRWKVAAVAVGLILLGVGAAWLGTVIIRVYRDGRKTVEVTVRPDGQVDVEPQKGKIEPEPPAPQQPTTPAGTVKTQGPTDPAAPPEGPTVVEITIPEGPPDRPPPAGGEPAVSPGPDQPAQPDSRDRSLAATIPRQPPAWPQGVPMSRMALVSQPTELPGASCWTIETRAHRGAVFTAGYSPDGQRIATGSADGAIRLWNADTGALVRMFLGQDGAVLCLAWSPDGSVLASGGSDHTIRLWEVESGVMLGTLAGHLGPVLTVAFSSDRRTLASAGSDKSVRLWDVASGKMRRALRQHDGEVYGVAFSSDGNLLASGAADKKVIIWDVVLGQLLSTLESQQGAVYAVAFSPGGTTVAAACGAAGRVGSVQLWDVSSGKPMEELPGHQHGDSCLAFSPDGQLLAAGGARHDGNVRIWDVFGRKLMQTLKKPSGASPAWCTCFSPDGQTVAVGGSRGVVQLWQTMSGQPVRTLPAHAAAVLGAAFSPDESTLACGYQDGTVRLWQTASGKPVCHISPQVEAVEQIVFSPDGKLLATSYASSGLVDVWNPASGQRVAQVRGINDVVESIVFAPEGSTLAVGGEQVQLWDASSGSLVQNLPARANAMVYSPDGTTLAVATGGDVRLLEARSGKLKQTLFSSRAELHIMAFSPDGKSLAAGSEDYKIFVWDVESSRLLHTFADHSSPVLSLRWLEDGVTLISGDRSEVYTWQAASGNVLHSVELDGGAISPLSHLIASRGPSTIRLHRLNDAQLLRTIVGLHNRCYLTLTPTLRWDVSPGWEEDFVYVVQTDTGQEMLTAKSFAAKYGRKGGAKPAR